MYVTFLATFFLRALGRSIVNMLAFETVKAHKTASSANYPIHYSNFAFANINFISARCSVKSMEPLRFIASSAFLTKASAASPVSTGTLLIAIAITVNTYVFSLQK